MSGEVGEGPVCCAAELGRWSGGNESHREVEANSLQEIMGVESGSGEDMRESTTGKNLKGHLIQSHHFLQCDDQMGMHI